MVEEKGVKRKMLTSNCFASAIQVKLEDDVNILRLTPFSSSSIDRDDFDVDAGQSLLVESQSFGSPIGQVDYAFP